MLVDVEMIFQPADCTSESNTSSSTDEVEKIISLSELEDIKVQAKEMLNKLVERSNERPVNKVNTIFAVVLLSHYVYFMLNVLTPY